MEENIKKSVYLIRHLLTDEHKKGVYIGDVGDPSISHGAKDEFLSKVKSLKDEMYSSDPALFSSPARRCVETLEMVCGEYKSDETRIKQVEGLADTKIGGFSGMTLKEIKAKYPDEFGKWVYKPDLVRFPGGETYGEVQRRAWDEFVRIVEDTGDKTVYICSHVDLIRMIVFKILEIPISRKKYLVIPLGSITKILVEHGQIKVAGVSW